MTFEKHLFISYAHADNKTTPDDNKGWVSRFHEYLESYLSTNIGEDAAIWRDERLRGNDIFASEIVEQFPHTAVLVSLLSPRYIESEWCIREVNEFCDVAGKHGGLVVDNKARVLRVMLTDRDRLHSALASTKCDPFRSQALRRKEARDARSFGCVCGERGVCRSARTVATCANTPAIVLGVRTGNQRRPPTALLGDEAHSVRRRYWSRRTRAGSRRSLCGANHRPARRHPKGRWGFLCVYRRRRWLTLTVVVQRAR